MFYTIKKNRTTITLLIVTILVLGLSFVSLSFSESLTVKAEAKTVVVPDDFPDLADAVGNATEGDTIFVKKGTYEVEENQVMDRPGHIIGIEINKTVSIIGEDPENTIVVFPPDTRIGFPILFSNKYGFYVNADNCRISNLTITNCDYGICLRRNRGQASNIITSSLIINGNYCNIFENSLIGLGAQSYPVYMSGSFNNYMQNKEIIIQCAGSYNYWDDYSGFDYNEDGLGDTPYIGINDSQDKHPLMAPITSFDAGTWEWTPFYVDVVSNSTVSDFSFSPESALIQFDVDGETGTTGFCRVTIPKDFLDADEGNWTVTLEGNPVTPKINKDTNSTYLYFTYSHSTKTVRIIGTDTIPEFPTWTILPLLFIAVLFAVTLRKQFHSLSAT